MMRRTRGLALCVLLLVTTACAAEEKPGVGLEEVKEATAAYRDRDAAIANGWDVVFTPDADDPNSACFDDPEQGGMGVHYVDADRLDDQLDPLKPEAMVYEVTSDGLELVAVEYVVPADAWEGDDAPTVLERDLHFNETLGLWALHAWNWKDNPAGTFEHFNPDVAPCPEELNL